MSDSELDFFMEKPELREEAKKIYQTFKEEAPELLEGYPNQCTPLVLIYSYLERHGKANLDGLINTLYHYRHVDDRVIHAYMFNANFRAQFGDFQRGREENKKKEEELRELTGLLEQRKEAIERQEKELEGSIGSLQSLRDRVYGSIDEILSDGDFLEAAAELGYDIKRTAGTGDHQADTMPEARAAEPHIGDNQQPHTGELKGEIRVVDMEPVEEEPEETFEPTEEEKSIRSFDISKLNKHDSNYIMSHYPDLVNVSTGEVQYTYDIAVYLKGIGHKDLTKLAFDPAKAEEDRPEPEEIKSSQKEVNYSISKIAERGGADGTKAINDISRMYGNVVDRDKGVIRHMGAIPSILEKYGINPREVVHEDDTASRNVVALFHRLRKRHRGPLGTGLKTETPKKEIRRKPRRKAVKKKPRKTRK